MRFTDLPLGARFELEGEIYRKVKPLIAAHETSGAQRLVARSATVRPLDAKPAPAAPRPAPNAAEVRAALDGFYGQAQTCLRRLAPAEAAALTSALADLAAAHRAALASLGLSAD